MSVKITSPIKGFSERSTFGPVTLDFKDGVAEVDELSPALRAYFETKGYKVERENEGPFDPSKHKADKVLAHLGLVEGSEPPTPEEYERVVAAEREGKARKNVLDVVEKAEADRIAAAAGLNPDGQDGGGENQGGDGQ